MQSRSQCNDAHPIHSKALNALLLIFGTQLALVTSTVFMTWACLFAVAAAARQYIIAEYIPYLLYCSLVMLLAFPLNTLHRSSRLFFCNTFKRVLLPLQPVSWADFLLADMLTSLAKSTGDFAQAMCAMATGPSMQRLVSPRFKGSPAICSPLSILSMAAVCLPYAIRFVQCIIVYSNTGNTNQVGVFTLGIPIPAQINHKPIT